VLLDRDVVMDCRTLVVLAASYNSTRSRYIVTVTLPALQGALHCLQNRQLTLIRDDVVQDAPPSCGSMSSLDTAVRARQSERLER
jgi:hypothetical protein